METAFRIAMLPLVCAAAAVAAFCVVLITGPVTNVGSPWLGESLTAFFAAAAWMSVGVRVAPRLPLAGAVLFVVGLGCAWFLNRGVVHSISPYYGLVPIASACVGGAIAWVVMNRMTGRGAFMLALVLPSIVLVAVTAVTLATPALAATRDLWNGDRDPIRVPMLMTDRGGVGVMYLWTETATTISLSERVRVEPDPGSGAGEYRLTPVREPVAIDALCADFRNATRAMIESEIARGSTPRFVTLLPFNLARCEQGTLWEAVPVASG